MPAEPLSAWSKAKWLRFILVIVAAVAGSQVVAYWLEERDTQKLVVDAISQSAATLQSKAPLAIDGSTTLTGATANNDQLSISYMLTFDIPSNKHTELQEELRRLAKKNICANAGFKTILSTGGRVVLSYSDRWNVQFTEVRFDGSSCT
ncbi:MAG: hypothetical protein K0R27_288 [Xanthobacteraceae bacterium]|nr:hypothetical protein [Xanthobacteraceae bacterium]